MQNYSQFVERLTVDRNATCYSRNK